VNTLTERAAQRADVTAPGAFAVARALGRIELRQLALNPIVLLGLALNALSFMFLVGLTGGELFKDDAFIGLLSFPLAGTTLIAVNLAVLRGRRDDLEELFGSLPTPAWVRSVAHAISLAAPMIYSIVLAVAGGIVERAMGGIGWFHSAELATGATLVLCAGLVGILLARIVPRAGLSPLVVVGIGFLEATMANAKGWQWSHLAPWLELQDEPVEVWFRPRGAHLVYLVGIAASLLAVTMLIQRRGRRQVVAVVVALGVVLGGAIVQSPLPTQADEARFAAWIEHPETVQHCDSRGTVMYCTYPSYDPYIARWTPTVEGVLALTPPDVRARPLTIRQRVSSANVRHLRTSLRAALSFKASETFWWPDDGGIHPDLHWCGERRMWGRCEAQLGNMIATWAVGLPLVRGAPPSDRKDEATGEPDLNLGLYDSGGEARAVVALWLTMEATPRTRASRTVGVAAGPDRYPIVLCPWDAAGPEPSVSWSDLDTGYARLLSELPSADVAARLASMWDHIIDPHTTSAELAKIFHLAKPNRERLEVAAGNDLC